MSKSTRKSGRSSLMYERGGRRLVEYTNRFDGMNVSSAKELKLDKSRLEAALRGHSRKQREALILAAEGVRRYHEKQLQASWHYTEADGTCLARK